MPAEATKRKNQTEVEGQIKRPIPSLKSILTQICRENPQKDPRKAVILISAPLPGSGSTTIANGVAEFLNQEYGEPEMRFVGGKVRQELQSGNDEDLSKNLNKVPDPLEFDRPFYRDLPEDRPLIVEGKLAVDAGPNFLREIGEDSTRPIIGIRLQSYPLLSAIRIMQREGKSLPELISNPEDIPPRATDLLKRTEHISEPLEKMMGSFKVKRLPDAVINLDTAKYNQQEIIGLLTDNVNWIDRSPDWEGRVLRDMISQLETISRTRGLTPNLKDAAHFKESIDSATYNLTERLFITTNAPGLAEIRANIRNMITHATFALLLKKIPRFLRRRLTNALEIDTISQKWTPEYYKIMVAWNTIKAYLEGQSVFDPFAGAGTFVNVLTARGIVKDAILGDISYVGGHPLNGGESYYEPNLNTAMMQAVFNGLPSWYKPECLSRLKTYVTLDATRLPFDDESFDWVTGDPPYGINLNDGGLDLFFEFIPEALRVSRKGGLFLVPVKWVDQIKEQGIEVQQLTDDLSSNHSDVPTCLIAIPKTQP